MGEITKLIPQGAHVFVRDELLFGDAQIAGIVLGIIFESPSDPFSEKIEFESFEYLVDFGHGFEQWINPASICGFLFLVEEAYETEYEQLEIEF